MSYDVFISYSRKDTATADKILAALESAGFRCFIDRVGISGGADFPAVLSDAIINSKLILLLASQNSYKSEYTQKELVFTVNNKGSQYLFPLIIDGSALPKNLEFMLSNINWRMLSEDYTIEHELVEDIRNRLENPGGFLPVFRKRSGIVLGKSMKMVLAAVAAALVLVIGGISLYRSGTQRALSRKARQGQETFQCLLDSARTRFAQADSLRDLGRPEQLFSDEVQALAAGEAFLGKADSVRSSLAGNPYASFPEKDYAHLAQIPSAKRDSLFAVWKPYALDNWNTWRRTGDPMEKDIAIQSVENALRLRPADQELISVYNDLNL